MIASPRLLASALCGWVGLAGCAIEVSSSRGVDPPAGIAPSDGPDIGTPPERVGAAVFNATLTGRDVVPAVYATSATATGTFTLDAARATLTYSVVHTLAEPTAAHLHLGIAGVAGDVLLPLDLTNGVVAGTVPVTPAQATALEEGRAYVDVHSAAYPDGEARGQVVRPGEVVYVARLTADQEVAPTETAGSGVGAFLVDGTANRMRFVVALDGMSDRPTVAVIGLGPAGVDGAPVLDLAEPKTLPSAVFTGERALTSTEDLDLGRWFVNVHTRRFPRGEVRGQILRPGQELYLTRMSGEGASPPVSSTASGSVAVIVDANRDRIIYDVALEGLTATSAELGDAPEGSSVIPMQVFGGSFRGMRMLTPSSTLLGSLAAGRAYASASSAAHPEGEIRGTLHRVGLPR